MEFKKLEIKSISQENPAYPSLLKEIQNPPLKIYVLGELPTEQKPRIAIVGTRKASLQGQSIAKEMARKLAGAGAVIVSGLAMGIDTSAHEGTLSVNGQTIAVLACGLDTIYPRQNENLAKKILDFKGAIISEYPSKTPALPHQFLERNRIVSGLSIATIIIEAPLESGALVTARLAAEQGREVFVVPGPINHPNYRGSHKLIRDGARLVASVDDILEDLGLEKQISRQPALQQSRDFEEQIKSKLNEEERLILEIIKDAGHPLNIDKIIEQTKLEPQIINQAIAPLILEGIIKETEKGYFI